MAVHVTGVRDIDRKLKRLALKDAKRIGRSAINKGMTPIAKAIKKATPKGPARWVKFSGVSTWVKGGLLRKSVGKRNNKSKRTGIHEAKVGYNVGINSKSKKKNAKYAHLFAAGTKNRRGRGKMPANKVVSRVYATNSQNSINIMRQAVNDGILKAARKK